MHLIKIGKEGILPSCPSPQFYIFVTHQDNLDCEIKSEIQNIKRIQYFHYLIMLRLKKVVFKV